MVAHAVSTRVVSRKIDVTRAQLTAGLSLLALVREREWEPREMRSQPGRSEGKPYYASHTHTHTLSISLFLRVCGETLRFARILQSGEDGVNRITRP